MLSLFFYVAISPHEQKKVEIGYLMGKEVPQFKLPLLDSDKNFTQEIFATEKQKFILLNFYASWCRVCKKDHIELLKFAKNKKVSIFGVMSGEDPETSKQWLEKEGNPYDLVAIDRYGKMNKIFYLLGVPESFLIKNNIIIAHFRGPIDVVKLNRIVDEY